jgi:hypothetical protein
LSSPARGNKFLVTKPVRQGDQKSSACTCFAWSPGQHTEVNRSAPRRPGRPGEVSTNSFRSRNVRGCHPDRDDSRSFEHTGSRDVRRNVQRTSSYVPAAGKGSRGTVRWSGRLGVHGRAPVTRRGPPGLALAEAAYVATTSASDTAAKAAVRMAPNALADMRMDRQCSSARHRAGIAAWRTASRAGLCLPFGPHSGRTNGRWSLVTGRDVGQ